MKTRIIQIGIFAFIFLLGSPIHSVHAQGLVINEIMSLNSSVISDPQGQYDDWIELYNSGDTPVSPGGLYLTDDIGNAKKWEIPDTVIAAGGYLIIWADNDSNETTGLHTNFRLGADGEYLGLYSDDASGNTVIDSLTSIAQRPDISYGRYPNGTGSFRLLVQPSPGNANSAEAVSALSSKVVINEILASNTKTLADPQGRFADWVELYNKSDSAVSLLGASMTDDPAAPGKWSFTDAVIPPNGYLLVWTDNDDTDLEGIHAAFRLDGTVGEFIGMYYSDGTDYAVIDSLSFGPQKADTSIGRLPNGTGEFREFAVPTPWEENALYIVSPRQSAIVINEIMASNTQTIEDPQFEFDDWIELYNRSDNTISLDGIYLTDNPDIPKKWQFPDVSIGPKGFIMVWTDGDTLDPGLHTNFRLNRAGEFIGLFDTDEAGNRVIDSLYYEQQEQDVSFGRTPDGSDTFAPFTNPSPGSANGIPTSINSETATPDEFYLFQNFPNPFNQGTVISFQLPKSAIVSLTVYNILGQPVRTLISGAVQNQGLQRVHWDGRDNHANAVSSGIYFYRLRTEGGFSTQRKMLVLK